MKHEEKHFEKFQSIVKVMKVIKIHQIAKKVNDTDVEFLLVPDALELKPNYNPANPEHAKLYAMGVMQGYLYASSLALYALEDLNAQAGDILYWEDEQFKLRREDEDRQS